MSDDISDYRQPLDIKPTPDPTILTTEQLLRETSSLKEYFKSEIKGAVGTIQEQFKGVEAKFISAEENKKIALDAAGKAVDKTEENFTKIIDVLTKRIDELRDSQKTSEGSKQGNVEMGKGTTDMVRLLITLAALAVAIIALFLKH